MGVDVRAGCLVTAYDQSMRESDFSNEVSTTP